VFEAPEIVKPVPNTSIEVNSVTKKLFGDYVVYSDDGKTATFKTRFMSSGKRVSKPYNRFEAAFESYIAAFASEFETNSLKEGGDVAENPPIVRFIHH
jgi:hypothetical protein